MQISIESQTSQRIQFAGVLLAGVLTLLIYSFLGSQVTHEVFRIA